MQRILRVLDTFDDDAFIFHLIKMYGKDVSIFCKNDQDIVYIDTPHSRYVSALSWSSENRKVTADELMEFAEKHGRHYSYISPSSFAMSMYMMHYAEKSWFMALDGYKSRMSRAAVYGGRCEVYRAGKAELWKYDINSSYPASAVVLRFPDTRRMTYAKNPSFSNIRNFSGVSMITYSQQGDYPVLPIRYNGRVIFGNNDACQGVYTHDELRYALEVGAIIIHQIHKQYICDGKIDAFTPIISHLWKLRETTGNSLYKSIMNALLGRMAMLPEGFYKYKVALKSNGDDVSKYPMHLLRRVKTGRDAYILMYGENVGGFVYSNPLWSAMINAHARCKLHASMSGMMAYVDTDCIITQEQRKDLDIGTGLGQWKEKQGEYNIKRAKGYDGPDGIKLSGIPERSKRKLFGKAHYTNERELQPDGTTRPLNLNGVSMRQPISNALYTLHIKDGNTIIETIPGLYGVTVQKKIEDMRDEGYTFDYEPFNDGKKQRKEVIKKKDKGHDDSQAGLFD